MGGKEGGGEVGRGRGRWRAGAGRPGKEREAEGGAVMGPRAAPGLARPPPAPRLCSRLDPLNCMRRASYAVEEEVVDLGTSARSRHNVLACRSGAPAAEQPRINGMTLWPVGNLLWPILGGPCLQYCLSICGNTWTCGALLSCLSLVCKTRWAGLFSSHCTLASTMCVCAYVRASILFFMSLVYMEFRYHPWSTCLLPCLLFASVGQALGRIIASLP